jgi:hypothetical protein
MKLNAKFFNLLFFATLMSGSTAMAAAMGYWLCLMFFQSPFNYYPYPIPDSLYWATGVILPTLSFLQSMVLFKLYLTVLKLENKNWRTKLLPFAAIFIPFWSIISPWALTHGTVWKYSHVAPNDVSEVYSRVLNAFFNGAPTLLNALIIALCIATYGTFVWLALGNLFGEYFLRLKNHSPAALANWRSATFPGR